MQSQHKVKVNLNERRVVWGFSLLNKRSVFLQCSLSPSLPLSSKRKPFQVFHIGAAIGELLILQ